MKAFPPGRRGVLLPLDDRRTAALGICMYTASKPWVIALQVSAYWFSRALGPRLLPGRTEPWCPPAADEDWRDLIAAWTTATGRIDRLAVYQRRQHDRSGVTLLLTRDGGPTAVVKLRDEAGTLDQEQRALRAIETARPATFHAPRPLGGGRVGPWWWSAQQAVFRRPHRPVLRCDPALFDEVHHILAEVVRPVGAGFQAAHGDLTPWNLRRDAGGQTWLFDWEDIVAAPPDTDRAYFAASAAALGAGPPPSGLPPAAVAYCRDLIRARSVTTRADAVLADGMLAALDAMNTDTPED